MNKKTLIGGFIALAFGGLILVSNPVEAYQGDPNVQGPNCTGERHEAMTQAFDNNDYNAWKELVNGRGRVSEVITEENFSQFAEAHRLALEGKTEEAAQIRQELGLGLRNGSGEGYRKGDGRGRWNR